MYLKVHNSKGMTIIAVCDRDLLGKKLADGEIELDLEKHSGFYKGTAASEEEVLAALKRGFSSLNFVGKKAVATAIKAGVVEQRDITYIKKVPHIQVYLI